MDCYYSNTARSGYRDWDIFFIRRYQSYSRLEQEFIDSQKEEMPEDAPWAAKVEGDDQRDRELFERLHHTIVERQLFLDPNFPEILLWS